MPAPPVPGPPAAVLSAILAGGPVSQPGGRAVFSTTNYPGLPSLMTEVVWLPLFANLQADVQVAGVLISQGWATGNVTAVTAAYTCQPSDAVILASATSAAFSVTLPDATQTGFFAGQRYTVIKTDSSGHNVTVNASAGQLISGGSSVSLTAANAYVGVVFDGVNTDNWWIWSSTSSLSGVSSVTAADTSIVVGGSAGAPTVATNTLDVIAADHPPAGNWSNNSHKITSLGSATASSDAAAYGQTPAGGATATVAQGGTGLGSLTAYELIAAGTASTSVVQQIGLGSSGQFLGSNGAGSVPSMQALPSATTSVAGLVKLDGTASDIQPTSTAAVAGAKGQAADAEHVHVQDFIGAFGDGTDGSITLDGSTTYNTWSSLGGSTYTMTRDVFATSLTLNNTVTLAPAGFRIFCQGTVTINGTVTVAGGSATGTNQGTSGTAGGGGGTVNGGHSGVGGGTGNGSNGNASTGVGTGAGGAGGAGETPPSTTTTGGSSATSVSTGTSWFKTPITALAGVQFNTCAAQSLQGGAGGAAGGGDGTNKGGAGGGGGGVIVIFAWAVTIGATGTLTAAGGNGGTPSTVVSNGGCGGGGGGAGGLVLVYTLAAWTNSGSVTAAFGSGGTKVSNGTGTAVNGGNGTAGFTLNQVLS